MIVEKWRPGKPPQSGNRIVLQLSGVVWDVSGLSRDELTRIAKTPALLRTDPDYLEAAVMADVRAELAGRQLMRWVCDWWVSL